MMHIRVSENQHRIAVDQPPISPQNFRGCVSSTIINERSTAPSPAITDTASPPPLSPVCPRTCNVLEAVQVIASPAVSQPHSLI
jgi:hypothetical protein